MKRPTIEALTEDCTALAKRKIGAEAELDIAEQKLAEALLAEAGIKLHEGEDGEIEALEGNGIIIDMITAEFFIIIERGAFTYNVGGFRKDQLEVQITNTPIIGKNARFTTFDLATRPDAYRVRRTAGGK